MSLTTSQVQTQFGKAATFLAAAKVSLTFSAVTKTGVKGNTDITQTSGDVGVWDAYTFSVTINLSDWTTPPSTGDEVVVVGDDTYQVLIHHDDPMGALRRLDLGEQYV